MECIFCRIGSHLSTSEILHETDRTISILDTNPIHYGHALVFPKRHCRDFLTLDESDFSDLLTVSQKVAQGMVAALELEGFNFFSNNGEIAGQSVFHFHFHITPRYPGDGVKLVHQIKSYHGETMAEFAHTIRQRIIT